MSKKTIKAVAVGKRQSADTILDSLDSLPPEEMNRVFDWSNGHPMNEAVSELLQLALEALGMFDKAWSVAETLLNDSGREASLVRRKLDGENAKQVFEQLREIAKGLQTKVQKFQRGPQSRAKRRKDRDTLIKQYLAVGTTDPKKILDALRRDAPELACHIKTIQNTLARLKHQGNPHP